MKKFLFLSIIFCFLFSLTGEARRIVLQKKITTTSGSSSNLTLNLASSSGLTYDSSLVDFSSGQAKLLNQWGSNVIWAATFHTSKNADYSANGGSLAATSVGTSAISGGKLLFSNAAAAHISFNPNLNSVWGQTFTIKAKVTLNFNGNAGAAQQHILGFWTDDGASWIQSIEFPCNSVAGFRGISSDDVPNSKTILANYTASSGVEKEIEYDADWSGNYYFYIDGALSVSSLASTALSHTFTSPKFWIGDRPDLDATAIANFAIRDVIIYNNIQHTSAYTAGYTPPSTTYSTADPTIKNTSAVTATSYLSFDAGSLASGSDSVKYCIEVGGTAYWYSGGWVSTGTCDSSHSSSASTINSNITTLTAGSTRVIAVLHSNDGSTTPSGAYATLAYK